MRNFFERKISSPSGRFGPLFLIFILSFSFLSGLTPPADDFPNDFCHDEQARKIKLDEKLIWGAASEVIDEISSLVKETKVDEGTKEEKRKKKKRFFKQLVRTIVNLAAKLAIKEVIGCIRETREDVVNIVIELCEDLHSVFESDGKIFEHEVYLPCLHCVFLEKDREARAIIIREKLSVTRGDASTRGDTSMRGDGSMRSDASLAHRPNQFLQEIISTLFECCSAKLVELNESFCGRIKEKYERLSNASITEMRSVGGEEKIEEKSKEVNVKVHDGCSTCYRVASSIIDRVRVEDRTLDRRFCSRSAVPSQRSPVPAILCLLRIIADVGDLAFGKNAGEDGEESRLSFLKKTTMLVKELYDFLACDDLLTSLTKLSDFVARLDKMKTDEEWGALAQKILESSQEGMTFLEDTFSNLNFYLQESLSKVFSGVFCRLSQALCTES